MDPDDISEEHDGDMPIKVDVMPSLVFEELWSGLSSTEQSLGPSDEIEAARTWLNCTMQGRAEGDDGTGANPMTIPITARQQRVLNAIRNYWHDAGISPTINEVREASGVRSASVMLDELDALEALGIIRRTPNMARSIVLCGRDAPRMSREVRDTIAEALNELDAAFSGPQRKPMAETVNARRWLDEAWPTLADVEDGVDVFSQFPVTGQEGTREQRICSSV